MEDTLYTNRRCIPVNNHPIEIGYQRLRGNRKKPISFNCSNYSGDRTCNKNNQSCKLFLRLEKINPNIIGFNLE